MHHGTDNETASSLKPEAGDLFGQQSALSDDALEQMLLEEENEFQELRKKQESFLSGTVDQQKWAGKELAELVEVTVRHLLHSDATLQDVKSLLSGDFASILPLDESWMPPPSSAEMEETEPSALSTFMDHLAIIVKSVWFDCVCTGVILCNAVFIGNSVEYAVEHARRGEATKNDTIAGVEYAFFAFYTLELILKLVVHKVRFFFNHDRNWNILDLFLVLTAVFDILYDAFSSDEEKGDSQNMTWMRLLRLLKMMKMLRVVRIMRSFRALRVMFYSIAAAVRSLFWAVVMLVLIMYIFGLCLIQGATGYLVDTADDPMNQAKQDIADYYSSVHDSIISLYMAITGGNDWSVYSSPFREGNAIYHVIFLFYISFVALAVLNVLTGIFVDVSFDAVQADKDTATFECATNGAFLKILGRENDENKYLSKQEFDRNVRQGKLTAFFSSIELEVPEAINLFRDLMSADGFVDIEEFENGLLKIRGMARTIDMMSLSRDFLKCTSQMNHFMRVVEDSINSLHQTLGDSGWRSQVSFSKKLTEYEDSRSKVRRAGSLQDNESNESGGTARRL